MGGFSRKIGHAFDRDGRRVEMSWSDLARAWFTRDELGRIGAGYQGAFDSPSTIMIAFAYDPASQLHQESRDKDLVTSPVLSAKLLRRRRLSREDEKPATR